MRSKGSYFNFGGLGVDVFLLEAALRLATVPNCSQPFAVRSEDHMAGPLAIPAKLVTFGGLNMRVM